MPFAWRLVIGSLVAAAIVVVARKRGSLSQSGAVTAFAFGIICSAAGWGWAALLIGFFVSGTLLSRYKAERKAARISGVVAKGGNRDAWQVLANGGFFSAAAAMSLVHPSSAWMGVGAGAIGAAAADTWATEIGVLSSHAPRSIISWKPVITGQSGGVTLAGTLAGVIGAMAMAAIAFIADWGEIAVIAAVLGGIGGTTIDSILGAALQVRRWCDRCNTTTEREVHDCGTRTTAVGGLSWLDNDAVNALSTAFGALLGFLCTLASRS